MGERGLDDGSRRVLGDDGYSLLIVAAVEFTGNHALANDESSYMPKHRFYYRGSPKSSDIGHNSVGNACLGAIEPDMRRVGLLGGTFDPPHLGHLIVAEVVRSSLGLDEVWLVVANRPWQKSNPKVE